MHQLLQGTSRNLRNKARLIKKKVWKPRGEILQARKGGEKTPRKSPKADKKTKGNTNYYSMFQSTTSYVLDDINSIAYVNDRIYNLMKFKPRVLWGKALKCKCSKSKCQAKYCQCFSRNQVCSGQCSCEGCNNTDPSRYESVKLKQPIGLEGCRCSKSECLKNYCQCFQRGESCSDKCKCANCKNSL